MRSRILLTLLLVFVVVLTPARAATFGISITRTGFTPSTLTVSVGDSVVWANADTANHQVESKSAGFTSPVLKPGETFTFTYQTPGRFAYQDQVVKKNRGTVTVQGATGPPIAVTAAASKALVVYGATVTLAGAVSSKRAGETVTVYAQPFGTPAPAAVGAAITGSDGRWTYLVRPKLQTAYQARWKPTATTATSPSLTVKVRPQVGLRVQAARGRVVTFFTKARGVRSFAGKVLFFQRRNAFGQWVTLRKVTLGSTSAATFKARLPRGRSRVRTFMPARQAGPGYVAGISRTLVLTR
jgi:plastocyanin